jgi:hypothetical protein
MRVYQRHSIDRRGTTLHADTGKISADAAQPMAARSSHMAAQIANGVPTTLLPDTCQTLCTTGNDTTTDFARRPCIHHAFEAQAASGYSTPKPLAFEGETLDPCRPEQSCHRAAHVLRDKVFGPDGSSAKIATVNKALLALWRL